MNRRSFFKVLLTAGTAIVVAPAAVLDDLAKAEHRRSFESRGRVYVDMGRVQQIDLSVHDSQWVRVDNDLWSANTGDFAVGPDGFIFKVDYALAL